MNNALFSLLNFGSQVNRQIVASAVLDFPSTAAAATSTLTIPVPGAQPGDVVALGLPATVNSGVLFDAYVSSYNTVTVRATNVTAAAIDPAAATYNVVVMNLSR